MNVIKLENNQFVAVSVFFETVHLATIGLINFIQTHGDKTKHEPNGKPHYTLLYRCATVTKVHNT